MRKKTNRESARIRPSGEANRICLSSLSQPSFAVLLIPSSGPFGQILSAPQRLPGIISSPFHFEIVRKEQLPHLVMLNEHLTQRSRWGGDRICPNGPDEGTSKSRAG